MNELIYKADAISAANDGADEWDGGCNLSRYVYIENAVQNVPAVQAVEIGQLSAMLGLWAPAPINAPEDWFHHGDENIQAWGEYLRDSVEKGYYVLPTGGVDIEIH